MENMGCKTCFIIAGVAAGIYFYPRVKESFTHQISAGNSQHYHTQLVKNQLDDSPFTKHQQKMFHKYMKYPPRFSHMKVSFHDRFGKPRP